MKTKQFSIVSCALLLSCLAWAGTGRAGEIHDAANKSNVEKVKALLAANPGLVNARDERLQQTPLHLAAGSTSSSGSDRKITVELLIARGADVNARDAQRRTPLHEVAYYDRKDIVELLLSKGADVNARDDSGETPLFMAASGGHKEVVELFLAKGLQVNAKGAYGRTPLQLAAGNGRKEVVELLIARGADINARDAFYGKTPLHEAAGGGHKDVVELLIARGADISVNDKNGMTPLQVAEKNGKTDIADLLRRPTGKVAGVNLDEGLAAARQQQWKVAIRHFLKAQDAAPTSPQVLFNLGLAESKVPGRELRAMAWFQAYLLVAPDAANAAAVRTEIANLKVRVEGAIEKLVERAKQLAGQFSGDDKRRFAFCNVAIAQIRTGDMDGARQTLRKVDLSLSGPDGLDDIGKAKYESRMWMHFKDRYEYKPINPLPTTAKDRLDKLLRLIKNDMGDEAFTDPHGALQTSAAKPDPDHILGGVLKMVEQLSDALNDLKALGG
jgi:ankyrin repeat protein